MNLRLVSIYSDGFIPEDAHIESNLLEKSIENFKLYSLYGFIPFKDCAIISLIEHLLSFAARVSIACKPSSIIIVFLIIYPPVNMYTSLCTCTQVCVHHVHILVYILYTFMCTPCIHSCIHRVNVHIFVHIMYTLLCTSCIHSCVQYTILCTPCQVKSNPDVNHWESYTYEDYVKLYDKEMM